MKRLLFVSLLLPLSAYAGDAQRLILGPNVTAQNAGNGTFTYQTQTIDSTDDGAEYLDLVPEAATITELCIRYNARVNGDPGAMTLALQGVSATTGRADGTTKQSGNSSCTLNPPASAAWDASLQCCTMTSSYTATQGELIAIKQSTASGVDASNGYTLTVAGNANGTAPGYLTPWYINNGTATHSDRWGVFGYKSASKTYGNPVISYTNTSFNSASTPDEQCLRFVIPSALCSTAELTGALILMRGPATGQSCDVVLYDGTTALRTHTIDGDISYQKSANDRRPYHIIFPGLSSLTCGSTYRICLKPDAAAAVELPRYNVTANADLGAYGGDGNFYFSSRTDAGAFSDTTTTLPMVQLILSTATTTGGGGSNKSSGINGGLN